MFYNQKGKGEFIEDYRRNRVVALTSLTGLFNKTAKYESKLKKDCSLFRLGEITDMYKSFNAKSTDVLQNYNIILKAYTAKQVYDNQAPHNYYGEITIDNLKECISDEVLAEKYLTREDIDDIEDQLLNYTDKAIVECLWAGISGKSMIELVSLEPSMVKWKEKTISFESHVHEVDDKLLFFLQKAFDEKEYVCYGSTTKVKVMVGNGLYKERDNVHTIDSDDKFFRWVYRKVQIYRKYLGISIMTMKTIQASGLLYKLQTLQAQHPELSFREIVATSEGKHISEQYGYSNDAYVDIITNKFKDITK